MPRRCSLSPAGVRIDALRPDGVWVPVGRGSVPPAGPLRLRPKHGHGRVLEVDGICAVSLAELDLLVGSASAADRRAARRELVELQRSAAAALPFERVAGHPDPRVRMAAVRSGVGEPALALGDTQVCVRMAAVEVVTDVPALLRCAETDPFEVVRVRAAGRALAVAPDADRARVCAQLAGSADALVRAAAVAGCDDAGLLARACGDVDDAVRLAALRRLDDPARWRSAARKDPSGAVRAFAALRCDDQVTVDHLARGDVDRFVRETALPRASRQVLRQVALSSPAWQVQAEAVRWLDPADPDDAAVLETLVGRPLAFPLQAAVCERLGLPSPGAGFAGPARFPGCPADRRPELVVVDVDGTLRGPTGVFSRPSLDALAAASAASVTVAVVTTRPAPDAAAVAVAAGGCSYVGCDDGRTLLDGRTGQVLWRASVPTGDVVSALELMRAEVPAVRLVRLVSDAADSARRAAPDAEDLLASAVRVRALTVSADPRPGESDGETRLRLARAARSAGLVVGPRRADGFELVPAADKGTMLELLQRLEGVARRDVVAFGDGKVDVAMFERAGRAVAVAGGPAEVAAAADELAAGPDGHGVATVLSRLLASVPARRSPALPPVRPRPVPRESRPYSGFAVRPDEVVAALGHAGVPLLFPRRFAEHVTASFGVPGAPAPQAGTLTVVGVGSDSFVQFAVVAVDGSVERPDGKVWHLTLSAEPGVEPVRSNAAIAESGWTPLAEPIELAVRPFPADA